MHGWLDKRRSIRSLGYVLPLLILMLFAFDLPMLGVLAFSLSPPDVTLAAYREILETPSYLRIIGRTVGIAALTTLICVAVAYPVAYWMRGLSARGRLLAVALIVTPFWVSVLVRTYALIVLLGSAGIVNSILLYAGLASKPIPFLYNTVGVTIGTVNALLPLAILPLFAAMARVDERLLQAAATLGADEATIFRRVLLPLTFPALATASILVFSMTLGFYVTPAILGGGRVPMIVSLLDLFINRLPRWELACALSIGLMGIAVGGYCLSLGIGRPQREIR
ncbi:ABC transporter permease [Labrys wisconsinensis]|uniref:Spermidine/putrescine transport system permease protein n=1 Tax=Labrys wisconsinensis TaxID=425677 RepID=A0ABU0J9X0_9HYPH|nr:ABC transporter permease [Labrys wisconsinensis]MDQ0471056.1 putative spermidine/putrescine transport system permease protein [Labrys wisconsinensis]